nr:uncharacterized protein LOC109189578 isoform X1 [Ipomoea trifida]
MVVAGVQTRSKRPGLPMQAVVRAFWFLWLRRVQNAVEEGEGGSGSFRSYEIIDNSTIPVNKLLKYGEYLEDMKDMLSEFFKTIEPAKSIICGY